MKQHQSTSGKRVLITGANGFVGRVLLRVLTEAGYEVVAALRTPCDLGDTVCYLVGDIHGATRWQEALNGVDTVIHLAARVHVMVEEEHQGTNPYTEVNVDGSLNLMEQAAAAGVRRFIYLSSIKVSGEESGASPFTEDAAACPHGAYAQSKYTAEQGLFAGAKQNGLEVVVIRPPLVYGPRVGANFLRLLHLVSRKIPLPFAALHNKRSLVYVENLVDLIRVCIEHPGAVAEVFNVADEEDRSFVSLIRLLALELKCPAFLLWVPPIMLRIAGALTGRSKEINRLCGVLQVDRTKAQRLLGWTPPYTTAQGVAETVAWFKSTL